MLLNPLPPTSFVASGKGEITEVSGRDRHKFFKRPIAGVAQWIPPSTSQLVPYVRPSDSKIQSASDYLEEQRRKAYRDVILLQRQADKLAMTNDRIEASQRLENSLYGSVGVPREVPAPDHSLAQSVLVTDAAVQTDYRENETQTDPYTPDYVMTLDEQGRPPEVLLLQSLTHKAGLPIGVAELKMIDRLRRRAEVEQNLPTGTDDASFNRKLAMLEDLEEKEWDEREEVLQKAMDQQLNSLKDALERREAAVDEKIAARVRDAQAKKAEALQERLRALAARRAKTQRMLATRIASTLPAKPPNRIDVLAAWGSNKPAKSSALIEAVGAGNKPVTYDIRPTLLAFTEGLDELEYTTARKAARVNPQAVKPIPDAPPPLTALARARMQEQEKQMMKSLGIGDSVVAAGAGATPLAISFGTQTARSNGPFGSTSFATAASIQYTLLPGQKPSDLPAGAVASAIELGEARKTGFRARKEREIAAHVDAAGESTKASKLAAEAEAAALIDARYRATPRVERPPTPVLILDGDAQDTRNPQRSVDDVDRAIILLQRLLRGRAMQNIFHDGRQRCRGLIAELQAASSAIDDEAATAPQQYQRASAAAVESFVDDVFDSIIASQAHESLHFLSRHLHRERARIKMSEVAAIAERTRAEREAAERDRRLVDEVTRQRAAARYYAVIRVVDTQCQSFVDDVLLSACRTVATATAEERAAAEEARIVAAASVADERTAVCNLLDMFAIPQIRRNRIRTSGEDSQHARAIAESATAALGIIFREIPKK